MTTPAMTPQAVRRMKKEHKQMRRALFKIMDLYAKAPGMAAPIPTTKLVWGMYQTALKAVASIEPTPKARS